MQRLTKYSMSMEWNDVHLIKILKYYTNFNMNEFLETANIKKAAIK